MSATLNGSKPASRPRRGPAPGGVHLGREHTPEARRLAAAILEVLAGGRTPTEAAQALGVSVPRYYQVESRALQHLLQGCESKPRGPGRSLDRELAGLRRDHQRLQREVTRLQSLLRAAQRGVGLTPPPIPAKTKGRKPRRQRTARALSVAARLQQSTSAAATPVAAPSSPEGTRQV
jgi:hypothetical protein